MIRILFIADVFGSAGRRALAHLLPQLRESHGLDLVVANGENVAGGVGITGNLAREIFDSGVDVITTGNHVWRYREVFEALNQMPRLLRPANYPPGAPGRGACVVRTPGGVEVGVANLMGRVFMTEMDDPFRCLDDLLAGELGRAAVSCVDFHAEATSEKQALAWQFDGSLSALVGTHTHVQTADERVLPGGTAYITDLGLTGVHESVIGMDRRIAIERFVTGRPMRMKAAKGDARLQGAVVTIDETSGKATGITRVDEPG